MVGSAQSFVGEASLPPVTKDGFYKILISPSTAVYLTPGFDNVRIFDREKKEVPYIFQQEDMSRTTREFNSYEILEKKQEPGCCTSLILHNPRQSLLNSINLIVKNAEVTKEATLLGSDDRKNWYALKQHFLLYPSANSGGTSEVKIVDFPLSNYIYYTLRIDDSTSAPLNILSAGYFQATIENGEYDEVPIERVSKTDSVAQKKTYVHLQFDTSRIVDKVDVSLSGQPYFLRRAKLYIKKERTLKRGGSEWFYDLFQEIEVNSRHETTIGLDGIKVQDLLLVVENEDNPSLDLAAVKTYQLKRYLTAWLKHDGQYTVRIGDSKSTKPVYDLSFFKDSIPGNPEVLTPGAVRVFAPTAEEPPFTFFTTKAFIWAAVVMVIGVLGFMSARLLKEAGSENKN